MSDSYTSTNFAPKRRRAARWLRILLWTAASLLLLLLIAAAAGAFWLRSVAQAALQFTRNLYALTKEYTDKKKCCSPRSRRGCGRCGRNG